MRGVHRARPSAVLALAVVLVAGGLAGCLSGGQGDGEGEGPSAPTRPGTDASDGGNGATTGAPAGDGQGATPPEQLPPIAEPAGIRLHFTDTAGLTNETPAAGSVPIEGGFHQFATDFEVTRFETVPLAAPLLLVDQDLEVTIWLEADAPVVTPGAFDVAVWFGSTRHLGQFGFTQLGAPALVPGTPTEVTFTIAFEGRPMVVPTGERLVAFVGSGALHEGTGVLRMHTGGEMASGVSLTVAAFNVDPVPTGPFLEERFSGQLTNFALTECDVQEGVTSATHTFTVGPNATFVEVTISASGATHTDVDITVLDAGQLLGGTHGPTANEGVLLAGPSAEGLAGKELTVHIYACSEVGGGYELVAQQA